MMCIVKSDTQINVIWSHKRILIFKVGYIWTDSAVAWIFECDTKEEVGLF